MCKRYALEWLDALITGSLNQKKTALENIPEEQLQAVIARITEEKERVQAFLKSQVFCLAKESRIALFVHQYHAALIMLLDQAINYRKAQKPDNTVLQQLYDTIISSIDELLSFIEVRFSTYMSLDERVPVTYLSVTKQELKNRVEALKTILGQRQANWQLADIVFQELFLFTGDTGEDQRVTFRELLYIKELVKELNALEESSESTSVYSPPDELLIHLNFNSKAYQKYLIQAITRSIDDAGNDTDKLDKLLFCFKEFRQIQCKTGVALNPLQPGLKTAIGNWFTQEIAYLEKKRQLAFVPPDRNAQRSSQVASSGAAPQKLLWTLSVDQMAIILRAAGELKIINVRSLNHLFKTIAPYLSTPYQENISYSSMRSKAYTAETRDKEIVIELLQKMIGVIREY